MLREDEGRILEICRSGKMTMRRGHHTSSVLKAMGARLHENTLPEDERRKEATAENTVQILNRHRSS